MNLNYIDPLWLWLGVAFVMCAAAVLIMFGVAIVATHFPRRAR